MYIYSGIKMQRCMKYLIICQFQVVWRKAADPHPISIGEFVYAPDKRYAVRIAVERREYNLDIHNIRKSDSGVYHCQVSTKEKLIRHILLNVIGKCLIYYDILLFVNMSLYRVDTLVFLLKNVLLILALEKDLYCLLFLK